MSEKLQVVVLCGGRSAEHEISLMSARNVISALDQNKYNVSVIYISKEGLWYLFDSLLFFLNAQNPELFINTSYSHRVAILLGENKKPLLAFTETQQPITVDIIFPVLHGTYAEDGTTQGLLKLADIPFVGADVLSSAVCMDKDFAKRLLREQNIPTARSITVKQQQKTKLNFNEVVDQFGLPFFVKPANTGSSVAVSKVKTESEFMPAVELAFQYDYKILIEEYIKGREIECAVLGNENPKASLPGEIVLHCEYYTYEAKYFDPKAVTLEIPACLPETLIQNIQKLAVHVYEVLGCEGMARIDFFVAENDKIYVNEANTIPGFTQTSMYPKMWQASGLSYGELLDQLIQLGRERHERDQKLNTKLMSTEVKL